MRCDRAAGQLRPPFANNVRKVAFHLAARARLQVHVCLQLQVGLNLEVNNPGYRVPGGGSLWDFIGYTMSDRLYESGDVPDKTAGGTSEASVDRAERKKKSVAAAQLLDASGQERLCDTKTEERDEPEWKRTRPPACSE